MESVTITVLDDSPGSPPVPGVAVRIFDAAGSIFVTGGTTSSAGVFASMLPAGTYQARFFRQQFSVQQPQQLVVEADRVNDFQVSGHAYRPPEATHPRLCRCSGFFLRPDGTPAAGHELHLHPIFDPLLFEGSAMMTSHLALSTDRQGYMSIDLVRGGRYSIAVEGMLDYHRVISVPDQPSANLPDLLFPVVARVVLEEEGPFALTVGTDYSVGVQVWLSDGSMLPDHAADHVRWSTNDPNVAVVLPAGGRLTLRGFKPGETELLATRTDRSIVRIPDTPIEGVPLAITVT